MRTLLLSIFFTVTGCAGLPTDMTVPASDTNATEDTYSEFRFDCKARFSRNESVILLLELPDRIDEDGNTEVEIALHGELMDAFYLRDGLGHKWYLATDKDLQIIMDAELNAGYYDFRDSEYAVAETHFECKKVRQR